MTKLSRRYPDLYAELLGEERFELKLPPNRSGRGQRPDLAREEWKKLANRAVSRAKNRLAKLKHDEFHDLAVEETRLIRYEDSADGSNS